MTRLAPILLLAAAPLCAKEPATNPTEPVAAVIREVFKERADTQPKETLCIDGATMLDIVALERRLATVKLRPLPAARCKGVTSEDSNPLVGRHTQWSDRRGRPAKWLRVVSLDCRSQLICTVDIDLPLNGWRYTVERGPEGWSVTYVQSRWIR